MAAVRYIEPDYGDEHVKRTFNTVELEYGFVPNILKAIGNCPELLTSFVPFWAKIYSSPYLSDRHRALAALGTANTYGCNYCMAHMTQSALRVGLTEEEILATGSDKGLGILNEKESLIIEFSSSLTKSPEGVNDVLLSKMKESFNDSEIVNLTLIVGLYNLTGRFLKALRIDVEPVFENT